MKSIFAMIAWTRQNETFSDNRYSRKHRWVFDGGLEVQASSSPSVVPVPMSDETAIDPEEAFVASISSCHMLWFLSIAASRGFIVDEYRDDAIGEMGKNANGKIAVTVVVLNPGTQFALNHRPTEEQIRAMHDKAHAECFIANSVTTEIRCVPVFDGTPNNVKG